MATGQPIETKNLDRYGNEPLPWTRAQAALEATGKKNDTWFLGTTGTDGRPHAAGVGALWHHGGLYFTSGAVTRKSKNLAQNAAASVGISLDGIDLVFEGEVERVTEDAALEELAGRYREGGWPVTVQGDAFTAPFSAPSAGPPPWQAYRFRFAKVYGVASSEPFGATRWRFEGAE
jgi:hypothetical protein